MPTGRRPHAGVCLIYGSDSAGVLAALRESDDRQAPSRPRSRRRRRTRVHVKPELRACRHNGWMVERRAVSRDWRISGPRITAARALLFARRTTFVIGLEQPTAAVWQFPLAVHSDSDPAFARSRRTDWSGNAVELAKDRRVGKSVDGLAVAIVAERQSPHDDVWSVLRLSIPAAATRFPRSPRER